MDFKDAAYRLVDTYNEFHTIAYNYFKDNNITEDDYNANTTDEVMDKFNAYMWENYHIRSRYRHHLIDENDYANDKNDLSSLLDGLVRISFSNDDGWNYLGAGYAFAEGKYELKKFDEEKLNKNIEKEKARKYDDLCERISAVVGEIEDVSQLRINAKGGLDGIVKGSKASATVNTIGAGGYNIQCFHYRTLVNKIR